MIAERPSPGERGQTSLLIVGFFLVAVLLVVVVVDASAAYLRRQELDAVADGAALAATEGLEADLVYLGGLGERAGIDAAAARRLVDDYLRAVGAHRQHPGLTYRVTTTVDTVAVSLSVPLELPFAPPGWAEQAMVTGSAASYVAVTD